MHCDNDGHDGRAGKTYLHTQKHRETEVRKFMLTSELYDGNSCMTKNGHFLALERCSFGSQGNDPILTVSSMLKFIDHFFAFHLLQVAIQPLTTHYMCARHFDTLKRACNWQAHSNICRNCLSFGIGKLFTRKILEKFFIRTPNKSLLYKKLATSIKLRFSWRRTSTSY